MVNYYCCAVGCTSAVAKRKLPLKYPWMRGVEFFPMPHLTWHPKQRKIWIDLIRRESSWIPNRFTRICSLHFVDRKPTALNPHPTIFKYHRPVKARPTKDRCHSKRMRSSCPQLPQPPVYMENPLNVFCNIVLNEEHHREVEPSLVPEPCAFEEHGHNSSPRQVDRKKQRYKNKRTLQDTVTPLPHADHDYIFGCGGMISSTASCQRTGSSADKQEKSHTVTLTSETQTNLVGLDLDKIQEENMSLNETLEQLQKLVGADNGFKMREAFVHKILENENKLMYYTGIPTLKFLYGLLDMVNDNYRIIKYWSGAHSAESKSYENSEKQKPGRTRRLSRLGELLLTLVRLRTGWIISAIADIFDTSATRTTEIFTTWIFILDEVTKPLRKWPTRQNIKRYMPPSLKKDYPKTTVIIDCTEYFTSRPANPTAQSATYSSYKNHNTYKNLVGISPSGAFIYVSDLYGGNASDRFITEQSGFLDHLRPGDEVMADRGFTIRDLVLQAGATLNIPPFTRKCSYGKGKRLNDSEIRRTKKIAKHRIHVERAIRRLKLFKLIDGNLCSNLKYVANQCVRVATALSNLQYPLIDK